MSDAQRFDANGGAFLSFLERLADFAADQEALGVICAVRLFEHEGALYGTATDRYRMIDRRLPEANDVPEGFDALIYADDLKRFLKTLGSAAARRKWFTPFEVSVSGGQVSFNYFDSRGESAQHTFSKVKGEYPNTRRLFSQRKPAAAVPAPFSADIKFLGSLGLPGAKKSAVTFWPSDDGRSVMFAADDNELGILMLINPQERPPIQEPWKTMLGATK